MYIVCVRQAPKARQQPCRADPFAVLSSLRAAAESDLVTSKTAAHVAPATLERFLPYEGASKNNRGGLCC
jgi:hypothetical protein